MLGMTTTPQRRWFHLTLDRLVLILLVWDGFLLLAARLYWLAKGWPVMIALATLGLALLLLLLRLAAAARVSLAVGVQHPLAAGAGRGRRHPAGLAGHRDAAGNAAATGDGGH